MKKYSYIGTIKCGRKVIFFVLNILRQSKKHTKYLFYSGNKKLGVFCLDLRHTSALFHSLTLLYKKEKQCQQQKTA